MAGLGQGQAPLLVAPGRHLHLAGAYVGERDVRGRPHGVGSQSFKDGARYKGEWANGQFAGIGELQVITLVITLTAELITGHVTVGSC